MLQQQVEQQVKAALEKERAAEQALAAELKAEQLALKERVQLQVRSMQGEYVLQMAVVALL